MANHRIHGLEGTPQYRCYMAMKQRCTNPNHRRWKDWGGRGIKVCRRWMKGFVYFWKDMGPTYKEGLTIERRDNNKDYSKANCYWADMRDQTRNRRSNIWVELVDGRQMVVADAAAIFGLRKDLVYARIRNGWPEARWFERVWPHARVPVAFDPSRVCRHIPNP